MATIKRPNELDEAAKRLNAARDSVQNMTYGNFKSGDLYQGLQRDYQQQGQMAMKDTLGQVAARTGGMASSYATTAANQSYNNYMKALEDAARSMYNEEYSRAQNQYNMAQQDYSNAYSQYRDSVADQRYADELAYQKSRDSISDQRYADEQKEIKRQSYLDSIIKSAATGIAPVWDQTMEEKFGITEADFDNAVNIGLSQYKNSAGYLSNQAATDERLKQIFGAEGFDWNKFDWDNDGKVGKDDDKEGTAADYFKNAGSAYGEDYWKQYSTDAQQGYADADTEEAQDEVMQILEAGGTPDTALLERAGWVTGDVKDDNGDGIPDEIPSGLTGAARTLWQNNIDAENEATALENEAKAEEDKIAAVNDIEARIAIGESLDEIKTAYKIDGTSKTWESVTGMSEAEWQQKYNDNEVKKYDYQNTPTGRNDIISALTDSASLSLSDKNRKNFDYLFGVGAYQTVQEVIEAAKHIQPPPVRYDEIQGGYRKESYNEATDKTTDDMINELINQLTETIDAITDDQIYAIFNSINPDIMNYYLAW